MSAWSRRPAGGTLFLDEVDALSPKAQIALLRFLQDGTYRPLGAKASLTSDARIIAATNADLAALAEKGSFRSDLLFRLMIMPIDMPPLRERTGDIALLARNFADRFAEQYGRERMAIDPPTLCVFERYRWPGNVRELSNIIHREFLLCESPSLTLGAASLRALGALDATAAAATFSDAKADANSASLAMI